MPTFTYTARAVNGELKQATIEAANRDDVIAQLRKQRLNVVKVDEGGREKKKRMGAIKMRDIVIFTRQFSTMINSGLPLVQALDILAQQSENPALKDVTRQVVFDVESGNTVADALRKHPKAFTELYVNMVAAGEAGVGEVDRHLFGEILPKRHAVTLSNRARRLTSPQPTDSTRAQCSRSSRW